MENTGISIMVSLFEDNETNQRSISITENQQPIFNIEDYSFGKKNGHVELPEPVRKMYDAIVELSNMYHADSLENIIHDKSA